ncbi:MAG: hypothetical protein NXI01_02680 [Gammaproteobacteria bacterium]|nr:hypothetical protein [Gammaproteobacteria bacterium]
MKHYLLGILLCTSTVYAECAHMKITIDNNTPETCLLVENHLKHGKINFYSAIPRTILSGAESFPILLEESLSPINPGIELSLTYQCGEGRQISILSQKSGCYSGNSTQAQITATSKMNATYDITSGNFWSPNQVGGSIYWTLY